MVGLAIGGGLEIIGGVSECRRVGGLDGEGGGGEGHGKSCLDIGTCGGEVGWLAAG